MSIFKELTKLFFPLLIFTHHIAPHCYKYKDCHTCTIHKTWSREPCRWCPLDQACHTNWSPKNHCISRQDIKQQSKCEPQGDFTYDADEAYKLALFAAIAYSDEPDKCLTALFPSGDYTVFSVIFKQCDDFVFDYNKRCLVLVTFSHRNQEVIIAYRGTRGVEQIVDQVLTIIAIPSVPSAIGGKVQWYFNNVHRKFYHTLRYLIQDLMQWLPGYKVKLTGHSLGGAAASITSAMLVKDKILKSEQVALYTFGMPRVGNKRYALAHDRLVPDSWRVVRSGDYIAKLPFCRLTLCSLFNGPYHHSTKVLYTESNMNKHSKYLICNGNEDSNSKCARTARTKRGIVNGLMDKHKFYFDVPIGTYCRDHVL